MELKITKIINSISKEDLAKSVVEYFSKPLHKNMKPTVSEMLNRNEFRSKLAEELSKPQKSLVSEYFSSGR